MADDDPEPRAGALLDRPDSGHFPITQRADFWESRRMGASPSLPTYVRPELPSNIHPERWGLAFEVHAPELPPQLSLDLRQLTPQAILRDLHRPVMQFYWEPTPIEGTAVIGQLTEEFLKLRGTRKLEQMPALEPSIAVVVGEQRRRRALMAQPWKPLLEDDAPRTNVRVWQGAEEEGEFYRPDFEKYERERKGGFGEKK